MSIICAMVTYCIGSARQKRAYFKKEKDCVILDNVEVLFCASENGLNYFAYGAPPFSAFTVEEYLRYRRALCPAADTGAALRRLKISPKKRIGSLTPAQMRAVSFVEKTGGKTDKRAVINLDGAKYSRKDRRALDLLLSVCGDAFVCVTDAKFMKREKRAYDILTFGKARKRRRARFYRAKRLAQMLGAARVAVM